MPTTVNGVGTRYFGRKNRSTRTDACRHCGRLADLESFDTRLWFVILFIPVIPLGRKRVIDSCSLCGLHVALDAGSYALAREEQIIQAVKRFRDAPSVNNALQGHATLVAFDDREKAATLRRDALARYPGRTDMLVGFAKTLDDHAARDLALPLYESALRLESDLPSARVGIAAKRMEEGRLDDARTMLAFLEAPGASRKHSLDPLRTLAEHFQQQGRHAEALAIAEYLLRAIPALGQQQEFRAFVRKSEKAQGTLHSILPARRRRSFLGLFGFGNNTGYARWQVRTALVATVVLLVAAGLALSNEYFRRNRTIFVLNATGFDLQVQLDDTAPKTFSGLGRLVAGEGHHRISLTGPVQETHEVDLHTSYGDRWFKKPVWVLNPGKEAVILESTIYYAANRIPSESRLVVGEPFMFRPNVDYAFEPPPESLKVPAGQKGHTAKTALEWILHDEDRVFESMLKRDRSAAFAFAERRLLRRQGDDDLLEAYLGAALPSDMPRLAAFLKSGLDRRPVVVPWHRSFQRVLEYQGKGAELESLYDRMLDVEPGNASLLYLMGLVERDWEKQESLLRRSTVADPRLAWPWLSLGIRACSAARWDEAVACLLKARELEMNVERISDPLQTARLGSGAALDIVAEMRVALQAQPADLTALTPMIEALAAAGQAEKIDAEINAWQNHAVSIVPPGAIATVRALGFYLAGKLKECADRCQSIPPLRFGRLNLYAVLGAKNSNDVLAEKSFTPVLDDPEAALRICLALFLDDQPNEAARWLDRACSVERGVPESLRRVHVLLRQPEPPPVATFDRLNVNVDAKALALAILAQRFPLSAREYLAAAARFNVRRRPPYWLIRRAIERGEKPASRPK